MNRTIRFRPPRVELPIPAAAAVIVTRRVAAGAWETRVDGGQLDGWTLATAGRAAALRCHRGAARLVKEAADLVDAGVG